MIKLSAVICELVAAGLSGDALVAAVQRIEIASTGNADRQARYRARKKERPVSFHQTDAPQKTAEILPSTPPPVKIHQPVVKNSPPKPVRNAVPEALEITQDMLEWAAANAPYPNPHSVAQTLIDYCNSHGKRYTDYRAAWRNFMKGESEKLASRPGAKPWAKPAPDKRNVNAVALIKNARAAGYTEQQIDGFTRTGAWPDAITGRASDDAINK